MVRNFCHMHDRQVKLSKSGDIADGRRHMEKAIALDCSCMPAYNVLVTYEMQRYICAILIAIIRTYIVSAVHFTQ